jgi:hypothetical protein
MPVINWNRPHFVTYAGIMLSPAPEGTFVTKAQLDTLKANRKFQAACEVGGLVTIKEDAESEKVAKDAGSVAIVPRMQNFAAEAAVTGGPAKPPVNAGAPTRPKGATPTAGTPAKTQAGGPAKPAANATNAPKG